jgi:hypothetical protein
VGTPGFGKRGKRGDGVFGPKAFDHLVSALSEVTVGRARSGVGGVDSWDGDSDTGEDRLAGKKAQGAV